MLDPYRVLVVDDEPQILRVLRPVLRSDGYEVDCASTGRESISMYAQSRPDAVILDLGLPDMDGGTVIRQLREWGETPILVLSARQEPEDKIAAIDAGANDYVSKPFHMGELSARLRNALRHQERLRDNANVYSALGLQIDFSARTVRFRDKLVRLTRKEYEILRVLAKHAGQIVTHGQLLEAAWKGKLTDNQYIRIYVGRIRQKLDTGPTEPSLIMTEPGIGYRLRVDAA